MAETRKQIDLTAITTNVTPLVDNTEALGTNTKRFTSLAVKNADIITLGGLAGETITNATNSSVVVGLCQGAATRVTSTLSAAGDGSIVLGNLTTPATNANTHPSTTFTQTISTGSGATGSIAHGNIAEYSFNAVAPQTLVGTITATGIGAIAGGSIGKVGNWLGPTTTTASITASGNGAIAHGYAINDTVITASGDGALALGYTGVVTASGGAAIQCGAGVNATANSVQVGNVTTTSSSGTGVQINASGNILAGVKSVAGGTETWTGGTAGSILVGKTSASNASGTSKITASGTGSIAAGDATNTTATTSEIKASGAGSIAIGQTGNGSTIQATGAGSGAFGKGVIQAAADNSFQFGPGSNGLAGIQTGQAGTVAGTAGVALRSTGTAIVLSKTGVAGVTSTETAGSLIVANSTSDTNAPIITSYAGSIIGGSLNSVGMSSASLVATGAGAFVFGRVNGNNTRSVQINAAQGGWAGGDASPIVGSGTSGTISAGVGALAHGQTLGQGIISASGAGSTALGKSVDSITASGDGSLAIGDSTAGAITASASNAFQFGVGTNNVANSLQVGGTIKTTGNIDTGGVFSVATVVGVSGSFTSADGKTITVTGGIITAIV